MLVFKQLVEEILASREVRPSNNLTVLWETVVDDTVKAVEDSTNYNKYKTIYLTKYGNWLSSVAGMTFPSNTELGIEAYIVAGNSVSRFTHESKKYKNIEITYPLLDLFCSMALAVNAARTGTPDFTKAFGDWENSIKSTTSETPLDYTPLNAWTRMLKADFLNRKFKEGAIGEIKLEQMGKATLYPAILHLAAFYKNTRTLKLPSKAKIAVISEDDYVSSLISKSSDVLSGNVTLNKKDLDVYDPSISSKIERVAILLRQLYIDQVNKYGSDDASKEALINDPAKYKEFINFGELNLNVAPKQITWS